MTRSRLPTWAPVVVVCGLALSFAFWQMSNWVERSQRQRDRGTEILAVLVDCTTPSTPGHPHECYDRGTASTAKVVDEIAGKAGCMNKETHGWPPLPGRTSTELQEMKTICSRLLGGDTLDFLRRIPR